MVWLGVLLGAIGLALGIAPSQTKPSGCKKDWTARNHKADKPKTCQIYIDEQWCTNEGRYGQGWASRWGSFEDYADADGNTALVCPQCGCNLLPDGKLIQDAKGKEYRLIEGEMTWQEAKETCSQMRSIESPGGWSWPWLLACLPTNEEFDEVAGKVQNLLSGSTCAETWVGLLAHGDNWYWDWVAGSVSSDDERWASGEPRNKGYAFIRSDGERGQLMSSKRKSKRCSVLCFEG